MVGPTYYNNPSNTVPVIRNQHGIHLSVIQMIGRSRIQMAFKTGPFGIQTLFDHCREYIFLSLRKKCQYLNKRMLNPFFHRPVPPQEILGIDNQRRVCRMIFSISQELIGSFWIPVPQDVLAKLKQLA